MQIIADVGGMPGKDCRGFCKYCYFRKVKDGDPLGCKLCSPGKVGCEHCTSGVREITTDFIPPFMVIGSVQNTLMMGGYKDQNLKVNISGGGDVSCYPNLMEISSAFKELSLPIHLGYTSGKGIDDAKIAEDLISLGVEEVTFTVFSTDTLIRKKWMGDQNPEESLKALKIFCENCEVHAASVIVPGANDGAQLFQTCSDLEEWGAKALILMRFANFENQGLILGLISNIEHDMSKIFVALGLTSLLDVMVTSQDSGFNKPHPEIFQEALRKAGVQPSEALYIGDQYQVDVVGANQVGMKGILLDRNGYFKEITGCPRIRSLTEVTEYL